MYGKCLVMSIEAFNVLDALAETIGDNLQPIRQFLDNWVMGETWRTWSCWDWVEMGWKYTWWVCNSLALGKPYTLCCLFLFCQFIQGSTNLFFWYKWNLVCVYIWKPSYEEPFQFAILCFCRFENLHLFRGTTSIHHEFNSGAVV